MVASISPLMRNPVIAARKIILDLTIETGCAIVAGQSCNLIILNANVPLGYYGRIKSIDWNNRACTKPPVTADGKIYCAPKNPNESEAAIEVLLRNEINMDLGLVKGTKIAHLVLYPSGITENTADYQGNTESMRLSNYIGEGLLQVMTSSRVHHLVYRSPQDIAEMARAEMATTNDVCDPDDFDPDDLEDGELWALQSEEDSQSEDSQSDLEDGEIVIVCDYSTSN